MFNMSDEKTLDFSKPEDVLKGFAIVDNNMRLLSAANVAMSERISELEYQVEITICNCWPKQMRICQIELVS